MWPMMWDLKQCDSCELHIDALYGHVNCSMSLRKGAREQSIAPKMFCVHWGMHVMCVCLPVWSRD
jgi:hypothetical protein